MDEKESLIEKWKIEGIVNDKRIIDAFREVKRENFIPKEYVSEAYADYPLPIGFGQTISQPTSIILMIKFLDAKDNHTVLEIGTGSGYTAALLSKLSKKVYTLEIVKELCEKSRQNLYDNLIGNVDVICADGSQGYLEKAPYDRIIINAAIPKIPEKIVEQLNIGGVIIAPVGTLYQQTMTKLIKTEEGFKISELGQFMFVPMKGKYGFG